MEVTGRLEDWTHDKEGFNVIWGHVYEDVRGRFRDGTWIHTSVLRHPKIAVHKEGDIVRTLNSTYLLGKPREIKE